MTGSAGRADRFCALSSLTRGGAGGEGARSGAGAGLADDGKRLSRGPFRRRCLLKLEGVQGERARDREPTRGLADDGKRWSRGPFQRISS